MLKKKISENYMDAFRQKDSVRKNLLSVVKGEIQTLEKNSGVENLSDDDVIKILNKTVKSINETIEKLPDGEAKDLAKIEKDIISAYLPQQMSESEIEDKIKNLMENGASSIGEIMKAFSSLPADKKDVSKIYRKLNS